MHPIFKLLPHTRRWLGLLTVTRDCMVPNRWRCTRAPLGVFLSQFHRMSHSLTHFCPRSSIAAGRSLISGHCTHLYPFLSLLAGWLGVAVLRWPLLVSRGAVFGGSHVRTGRSNYEPEKLLEAGDTGIYDTWLSEIKLLLPFPRCQPVILAPVPWNKSSCCAGRRARASLVLLREDGEEDPDTATRSSR